MAGSTANSLSLREALIATPGERSEARDALENKENEDDDNTLNRTIRN